MACPWIGKTKHFYVHYYFRVVSIELVTANGEIVCCDHIDEKDLFYALRGGGGISFGLLPLQSL